MVQILHSNARTREATRRAIRLCKKSIKETSKLFNVNPKTVFKWRKRESPKDLPMGPKERKSKVLSNVNFGFI